MGQPVDRPRLVRERLAVHALHNLRDARAILRLAEGHDRIRLDQACQQAFDAADGRHRTVRGTLERSLELVAAEGPPQPVTTGGYLNGPNAPLRWPTAWHRVR